MKLINTSNRPFEFTWDGGNYGPILPGQIVDYPDNMANHCMKRSAVLFQDGDQTGDIEYYQMVPLDSVDKKTVKEIAVFDCPFKQGGMCNDGPFKSMSDLKAHLESHWELLPEQPPKQQATQQTLRK